MSNNKADIKAHQTEKDNYGYQGKPLAWRQGFDKGWLEASAHKDKEIAASEKRIAELEKALNNIKKHQEIVAGNSAVELSATWQIANKALASQPTEKDE